MTEVTEPKPSLWRRVLGSPPLRVLILGFILLLMMGLNTDILVSFADQPSKGLQHIIALALAGFVVYKGFGRLTEQESPPELSTKGMLPELGIGLSVGAGLYTASVLILIVLGIYKIEGLNSWQLMVPAISMALSSGVFEELLFRGVLFGSVEKWFGSWAALVVSALLFGLVHLMNPAATLEGALFIAVEAGILLAGAYMLTRRLWMSMGFHFAWNFTQSGIFSGIVSGNEASDGLIKASMSGPDLLTGGKFGVESSIIALTLCTATGIALVVMAAKGGKIVPPIWMRKSTEPAAE